jgi:PKD repeat protein
MHVLVNADLDVNDPIEPKDELGTIDLTKEHVHFSRLSSYKVTDNPNVLPGYEMNSSNCLNPLENFENDDEKDPFGTIPWLANYTIPSVLFKNNFSESYALNWTTLGRLNNPSSPLPFYNVLLNYLTEKGPKDFSNPDDYWAFIKSIVTDQQLEINKNYIIKNALFQEQQQIESPANSNEPYILYGKIDILAEAYDKMNSNPLNHGNTLNGVGYWVENISGGGSNIIGGDQKPYMLFRMDDNWMKDISVNYDYSDYDIFNDMLYDKDLILENPVEHPDWSRRNSHYIVTNAKGTDGKVANIDGFQYWNTKAHIDNPSPNGYNPGFKEASVNKEAKFKDGEYRVHIRMEDLLYPKYPEHGVDDGSTVIILDNYAPYIESLEILAGTNSIYDEGWNWNETSKQLEFNPECKNAAANGSNDVSIIVHTSEPMANVAIKIENLLADYIAATPYNGNTTQWQIIIPAQNILAKYQPGKSAYYWISVKGNDLAGNSIQGFKKGDNYIPFSNLCIRDNTGNWVNQTALQPDTKHYLKIGDTFKNWNGCMEADFSASQTNINDHETITFTDNSYGLITQWNWIFEGGVPSHATGKGPHQVSYPLAGNYKASLTVSEESVESTEEKIITVNSSQASLADIDFIYNIQTGEFVGKSSLSDVEEWLWTFSNGTETGQVVKHHFEIIEISHKATLTVKYKEDHSTKSKTQRLIDCGYPFRD